MDWRKKCILCDKKGGNLLVCKADDACPISVHQSCMDCEARFDDEGNFHCPYCRYKQSASEFCQLRETVMLTKQALSNFLEEEQQQQPRDSNQQQVVGLVDKVKGTSSTIEKLVDVNYPVPGDVVVSLEKHQQSKMPLPCDTFISGEQGADVNNTCQIMVLYKPNSNPVDAEDSIGFKSYEEQDMVLKTGQRGSGKVKGGNRTRNANQHHATSIEEEEEEAPPVQSKSADILSSIKKQVTRKKRINSVAFNENERIKRRKQCMMETLVSLQNGSQLQSNPNGKKIDPNRKASSGTKNISSIPNSGELKKDYYSKQQLKLFFEMQQLKLNKKIAHNDPPPERLLDHLDDDARKGSLSTKNANTSNSGEVKDSPEQQSEPNRKIDHSDSPGLLDHNPNDARKGSLETNSANINNPGELKDPSVVRSMELLLQHGKYRVLWSEQEVDMLKEGVQKFTSSKRKNLPWKKILDFGRHVFDPCRNPSDLKDKWRKIAKHTEATTIDLD